MEQPTPTPTLSLSLTINEAAEALEFYTKALNAKELYRLSLPDGSVAHAEFMVGNCRLFISGPDESWQAAANPADHTASCLFCIESEDPDTEYQRALDAGCTSVSEPTIQIFGARTAVIKDPYGYRWVFRKVVEQVSQEEINKRFAAATAS